MGFCGFGVFGNILPLVYPQEFSFIYGVEKKQFSFF